MSWIRKNIPGLGLCLVIAVPSAIAGSFWPVVGGPVIAIILGMIVALFLPSRERVQPGIGFTAKKILQYAVVLLGFGMNLTVVVKTGVQSLPIIVATICTALIVAYILYKVLKMPEKISVLIGVGSSICGGSAIAATAPVIKANDEEIAQSISVIFLFNVLAALIFPTLGQILGLSELGFGLFAGTAVNDTSSVTAAAAAWDGMHPGHNTLDAATVVKLTRTLAIIPITLILAFYQGRKAKQSGASVSMGKIFPLFILGFIIASVITTIAQSLGVSAEFFAPFKTLSKFMIVMAMAAIGLNTDIVKLVKTGGKPILMGFICWVAIAAVSLVVQHLMGLW